MRTATVVAVLAVGIIGCGEHGKSPVTGAHGVEDAPLARNCPPPGVSTKLAFTRETSCANDGSVEFCLPDQPELVGRVAKIAPAAHCEPGGGRAGCNITPGLLLCTLPTRFPAECLASHGAMTDDAWAETCAITSIDEVRVIVATIFE